MGGFNTIYINNITNDANNITTRQLYRATDVHNYDSSLTFLTGAQSTVICIDFHLVRCVRSVSCERAGDGY